MEICIKTMITDYLLLPGLTLFFPLGPFGEREETVTIQDQVGDARRRTT